MRHLLDLFERFRADERGAFAIIFGLMAIVLFALAGAVVDFVSLQQARNRAQVALDAATLALQPEIFEEGTTAAGLATQAQALIVERIGDARISATVDPANVTINVEDGSLYIQAGLVVPTIFVRLVGVDELRAAVLAEATRKKLELEIAMVLDNSGSMVFYNRMTYLKAAARCAANIIFYDNNVNVSCEPNTGAEVSDNVKMAIVPFTMFVNVGSGNAAQPWLDWSGASPMSKENFSNPDPSIITYSGSPNRASLFSSIGVSWRGCVIARSSPYDVDDTEPTASTPATLFTPYFAPDEPTGWPNSYISDTPNACKYIGTCTWTQVKRNCTSYNNCTGTTTNSYSLGGARVGSLSCTCPTSSSTWTSDTGTNSYSGTNNNRTYTRVRTCNYSYDAQGLTPQQLQERICKYSGQTATNTSTGGPNANCPSIAIQALTTSPSTVTGKISTMVADGGTNIQQGAAWGFHTLSPTTPFTEGSAYDTATSKVMILMTDGENYNSWQDFYNNFNGTYYYSAYGHRLNGHVTGNSNDALIAIMNSKTVETCNAAKEAGITIYTIGLSAPNLATKDMLTACSSGSGYNYFPNNPSELLDIFKQIAGQLAQLRLAR